MRNFAVFALTVLILSLSSLNARAETRTLFSVADSFVSADEPDVNFNESPLGLISSPKHLTYLKFDLTPIEDRKTSSAILRLYQTDSENPQQGQSQVKWAASEWSENEITHENRPPDRSMSPPVLRTTYESTVCDFPYDITHHVNAVLSGDERMMTLVVGLAGGQAVWEDRENSRGTGNIPRLEVVLDEEDPILPGMGDFPFPGGFTWTVDAENGLRRDGRPYYMEGMGLSTGTTICGRYELYETLTRIHKVGFNLVRLYAPPSDAYMYDTIISVCEEWNRDHPDGGDPNKAMHYMIEFKPRTRDGKMPDLDDPASIEESLHGDHPLSLKSTVRAVNHHKPRHLLAYILGHEFTWSPGLRDWLRQYGPEKIEAFFKLTGDALRTKYAPGILMSHEADGRATYERFEDVDDVPGNMLAGCDFLGHNWYPDTKAMVDGAIATLLKKWRDQSGSRGWYVGETSPTTDVDCPKWSARNYTQPQAAANIEMYYRLCRKVGGKVGFDLFKSTDDGNAAAGKQRGVFDWYHSPKMRYFMHTQLESDPSNRTFENDDCRISGKVTGRRVTWSARNKTDRPQYLRLEKLGASDSPQYFEPIEPARDVLVMPGKMVRGMFSLDPSACGGDYIISLRMLSDTDPLNAYPNGRDGLCTGATLLWTKGR